MGAQSFCTTIIAENARQAFEMLTGEATYEKGHDHYNGTISTCSMGRCRRSYNTYSKKNEKEAYDFIKKDGNGEKWVASYIDLGVIKYVKRTVKKVVKTYDAKYKQKFCVINAETGRLVDRKAMFDSKGEADAYAVPYALKGMDVSVIKDMVKLSGNNTVSTFEVTETQHDKAPKISAANAKTTSVRELRKFIFYGWAAC